MEQIRDFFSIGKTIILVSHTESDANAISDLATRTLTLSRDRIQEVRTPKFEQIQQSEILDRGCLHSQKLVIKPVNLISMLLGQTQAELLKLLRQPVFLLGMMVLYSVGAFIPKNEPNAVIYLTSLAAINLLLVAVEKFSVQIAAERKQGWTKLLRVTPLPAYVYLASKIVIASVVSILGIGLMFSLGAFRADINLPLSNWVMLFSSLILGIIPFATLGFAIGYWIDANSISIFTTLILGLALLSSGSLPFPGMPEWLQNLIPFSPFYHYAQLVTQTIHPQLSGIYNNYLAIHIEWLTCTTCISSFLAVWGYRRDQAIG